MTAGKGACAESAVCAVQRAQPAELVLALYRAEFRAAAGVPACRLAPAATASVAGVRIRRDVLISVVISGCSLSWFVLVSIYRPVVWWRLCEISAELANKSSKPDDSFRIWETQKRARHLRHRKHGSLPLRVVLQSSRLCVFKACYRQIFAFLRLTSTRALTSQEHQFASQGSCTVGCPNWRSARRYAAFEPFIEEA